MPEIKEQSFNFTEKVYIFSHEEILDTLLAKHDYDYWIHLGVDDMKKIEIYSAGDDKLKIIVRCKKPL